MLLSCIPFNGKEVFKILLEKVQSSATQWTSKAKYIYIYIYIYEDEHCLVILKRLLVLNWKYWFN